jgi:hypothetical protein
VWKVQGREPLIGGVMVIMSTNPLPYFVMLLVLGATGCVAGGEAVLELTPRDQHHSELVFPLDNKYLKLWLCDYESRANADLVVAVDVIRGGKRERLGEAATSVDRESRGLIYLACSEEGNAVMPRAIGVTGHGGGLRQRSALAPVPLAPTQAFERTACISKAFEVQADKEAFAYLFLYRDQDARKPLTFPDLRDDSPFDSMRPDDIRKTAEALPDAVTILVTVRAELPKP